MRAIHLILISLVFGCSFQNSSAEVFSEFGIIRANIAHYCRGHRWLVCCEPKRFPEASEVVAFDSEGSIIRIRGDLRPGAKDMLSLESYEKPSLTFSTKEGYIYILNAGDEEKQKQSKYYVIYGIVGIFVMVSVWGLVNLLKNTFNLSTTQPTLPTVPCGTPTAGGIQPGCN